MLPRCRQSIVSSKMNDLKKDNFFVEHLRDLAERAKRIDFPVFTNFMTTREFSLLKANERTLQGVRIVTWGGHEDCDHKMCGLFPLHYDMTLGNTLFPIECICIEANNHKYGKELSHRDYLGAILNLGIERSMIGDIRICNQSTAYAFCNQEFVPFLINELNMVRHTSVTCKVVESIDEIPAQEYEVIQRSIASMRLDNVVAALIGSARGKASELILQGKVIADYKECTSNSYRCKDGIIVTVRGFGKYKVHAQNEDYTRKGKQKITIYKYK